MQWRANHFLNSASTVKLHWGAILPFLGTGPIQGPGACRVRGHHHGPSALIVANEFFRRRARHFRDFLLNLRHILAHLLFLQGLFATPAQCVSFLPGPRDAFGAASSLANDVVVAA